MRARLSGASFGRILVLPGTRVTGANFSRTAGGGAAEGGGRGGVERAASRREQGARQPEAAQQGSGSGGKTRTKGGAMFECHELGGPVLLRAGPGTGKTFRLGRRIKHLVEERQLDPQSVAVITFTVAAAVSMRAAISQPGQPALFLEPAQQPRMVRTMHSLGHGIICSVAPRLGLTTPVSVLRSDFMRDVLAGDAAQLAGYDRSARGAATECRQMGDCQPGAAPKCDVCNWYQRILRACNAVDHDDQILLACYLLSTNAGLLAEYRSRCRHLLVDEHQDINAGQFRLISLLSEGQRDGLFAVGDDDQSIYSWRGGSPEFVRRFQEDFGAECKVEPLLHSYRCPEAILESATKVVKTYDPAYSQKGEFTYGAPGAEKVVVHTVPSAKREAIEVRRIAERAWPAREVLILIPHRGFLFFIAQELQSARIQYVGPETLGGQGFPMLERLGAWLHDETDSLALRECMEAVLNGSRLGLPSPRVRKAERIAERDQAFSQVSRLWQEVVAEGRPLWDCLRSHRGDHEIPGRLCDDLERLRAAGQESPAALAAAAVERLEPWRNTEDMLGEIEGWVRRSPADVGLSSPGMVRIMTFQGAKGLEADVVCALGFEEGVHPRKGVTGARLAEAARLTYVVMTRAKSELHLFYAKQRPAWMAFQSAHSADGAHTFKRSRFLEALPKAYVESVYHPA